MSDFSGIQPPGSGGGKFPPIQKGKDFFDQFPHCRDDGERIELFVNTAQRQDAPLKALEELLKYRDQFYLTMGLQSFAYIGNQTIRTKLANLDYIDGLDEPLDKIYQLPNPDDYKCHSQRIFEKLSQEAQSGSELTRLSAAWTIQQLKYPQIVSARFLFKSVEDIQRQIISENLKRLSDRYLLNDPIRYKEFLDFWVYAPKNHLLQLLQSISANSLKIVDDVLTRLGVAGFELVTQAYGLQKFVVEAGLRSADSLFRDRDYQDSETRERLSKALIPFLGNSDIDLRRLVAKTINEAGSWLKTDIRAKAAVISRDWNSNVVRLGEASVPFLLQAIRGSLILDTRDNLLEQVKAVQCIGTIYAANIDKKIRSLVEFLQHREESVRDATVSLLKQHQDRLDQNSRYILTALDFQFRLPQINFFNFTSLAEIEIEITSTRKYQTEIERIFQNAISSCKADATEVLSFLSSKQKEYNILLSQHFQSLEDSKSRIRLKAAESFKNEIRETGRFLRSGVLLSVVIIITYISYPTFLYAIKNPTLIINSMVLYYQNSPRLMQDFVLGIMLGPLGLFGGGFILCIKLVTCIVGCMPGIINDFVGVIGGLIGTVLYIIIIPLICILPSGILQMVSYLLLEIDFMLKFIIKRLID
ncbi:hypothetical protein [Microcoleus sp. OTE_8_concoct_300]|uniref:hypothetical protein n=1 Tax=Microcoleus sp. OTE_8_concoct_300 TaxID=2964710 RepID=UPI00403FA9AD